MIDWDKDVKKRSKHVTKDISDKIHQKCEPLLKWLQEAEEESDGSEEEGVQIAFDDRVHANGIKEENHLQNGMAAKQEEEKARKEEDSENESDVDIDNI